MLARHTPRPMDKKTSPVCDIVNLYGGRSKTYGMAAKKRNKMANVKAV